MVHQTMNSSSASAARASRMTTHMRCVCVRSVMAAILGIAAGCAEPATAPAANDTPGMSRSNGAAVVAARGNVAPRVTAAPTAIARARARWLPVPWSELPGWNDDRTRELWPALLAGCAKPADGWTDVCALARALQPADDAQAREFLQRTLQPYRIESLDGQASGLATGYFEPYLQASRLPR